MTALDRDGLTEAFDGPWDNYALSGPSLSRDEWIARRGEIAQAIKRARTTTAGITAVADRFMADKYGECPPEPPPSFGIPSGGIVKAHMPPSGAAIRFAGLPYCFDATPSEARALEDAIRTCREWCERQEAA